MNVSKFKCRTTAMFFSSLHAPWVQDTMIDNVHMSMVSWGSRSPWF